MVRRRVFFAVAALLAGVVAGTLGISSCKDDTPATLPAVKAPTTVKGPSREEVLAKENPENAVNINDFERIPDLGPHVMYRTPDGEVWQKYSNNLMLQHLRVGNKGTPRAGQTVSVAYQGTIPGNNKPFDSATAEKPFRFVLGKKNSVIKGWTLAISTMRPGGKIKVWIPPELGYGAKGKLPTIGSNSALLFEIELLSVSGDPVEFPTTATSPGTIPSLDALRPKSLGPDLPATKPAK